MTVALSSPRFLFRIEQTLPRSEGEPYPLIDEYSLASRLSYFLWSTMPDEELFRLAREGKLRDNLPAQVKRMLADSRSKTLVRNFVGQWLQARDVDSISIDPLAARGVREEYDELREMLFRRGFRRGSEERDDDPPEIKAARARYMELRELRDGIDEELKRDMRHETEKLFEHIVRENRSTLELLDADYTFLNERLADHYGIEGVEGDEMRLVMLPADSLRGGVLTQGTFLLVTSNPTRTSPVKRGLFILENLLGTPTPPPPALVPELEESKKAISDHKPSLRELLEVHREQALCSSCHSRFDPLGLALENFNALGEWREEDAGQPINPAGELITGETFASVEELKQVLVTSRRRDFYRCLAEKMLTYALGRGLEYYDEQTLDDLVSGMEKDEGRFLALLLGIVESAPFQRQRPAGGSLQTAAAGKPSHSEIEETP
jgi:hypothetical protein